MTGWVVVYVLSVSLIVRHVIRTRLDARRPPFQSWVQTDPPVVEAAQPVVEEPTALAWTDLDDRQLERFLSQSSS